MLGVVAVLAVLAAYGLTQGWFAAAGAHTEIVSSAVGGEPVTVTRWSDPISRDLMLAGLDGTSLYLCGNAFVSDAHAIAYRGGVWRAADTAVEPGDLRSLAPLEKRTGLSELALVDQGITEIFGIGALAALTYLDLSGNPIGDLAPLAELTRLKTLKLLHGTAQDLTVLLELPALERVYISLDMLEAAKPLLTAEFDVIVKE